MSSRPRCSTARASCPVATLFASCLGVAFGLSAQVASGASGDTELISIDAGTGLPNGGTLTLQRSDMDRVMSADGRYVVFHRDGRYWRRDRQAGTTVIVAAAPNVSSLVYSPSITPDGRYVAFSSAATGLVTGDTNGHIDVFVRDMSTGTIERVSVSTSGTQSNGDSRGVSISADGRYVAFASVASNLTAGDTNGFDDVFLRDRQLGTTTRLQSSLHQHDTDARARRSQRTPTTSRFRKRPMMAAGGRPSSIARWVISSSESDEIRTNRGSARMAIMSP